MRKTFFLVSLIFLIIPFSAFAQTKFAAKSVDRRSAQSLTTHFSDYRLFEINTAELKQFARKNRDVNFQLELPGYTTWDLDLFAYDILAADYKLTVGTINGPVVSGKPECITYRGRINNDGASKVSLTMNEDIIYGMIRTGNKEFFIEPLHYFQKGAEEHIYVVYETKDVNIDPSLTCGVTEMKNEQQKLMSPVSTSAGTNCVQVQVAIASDESMYIRYGSAANVETHNIGVMSNVIWDYVNAQFTDNIEFVIVAQNVSTTAATDQLSPAYTGTMASTVLGNFRAWGQAGNFGVTFDVAQLWTTRNIDNDGLGGGSGTIGLAYVGVVCTSNRYHLLEDFAGSNPSGSGFQLRVVTSHEIGHNFNANHDAAGSGFIMAPSVNNTSVWSAASITSVDAHVASRVCLSQCSLAGAPVADFIATPDAVCTGTVMQFIDHTLQGPTSWSWVFTGGTPATSTVRNPSATFATTGIKGISLTATNGSGSDVFFKSILVSSAPVAACANTGTSTSNAGITNFSLNNLSNNSSGVATDGNKYMDYTCTRNTVLAAGTSYTASATVGTTVPANEFNLVQFFIDYNNDGDFLDASEAIYSSPSCYIGTHSFSFTTLASPPVTNQFLRARVIAKDCFGGINSCYNVTNGQVEDYAVYFAAGALPVSMLEFDGIHSNGKNILNWITSSEVNSSHFEIERSTDGTTFSRIGNVTASLNSTVNRTYTFTDPLTDAGNNTSFYYRLQGVDMAGRRDQSNVVNIRIPKTGNTFTVYPNPVRSEQSINISGTGFIRQLELFNELGQVVYATKDITGGIIPVSPKWPAGNYSIRIVTEKEVQVKKIVILK